MQPHAAPNASHIPQDVQHSHIKIDLACAKDEGWLSSGHCVNDGQKNMLVAPEEKHIAKVAMSASANAMAP